MAKRERVRPGTCSYCGQDTRVEDEHVVPKTLWPESERNQVPFIRVPACIPCNRDKSRMDDALRDRLFLDATSDGRRELRYQLEKIARSTNRRRSKVGLAAKAAIDRALAEARHEHTLIMAEVEPEPFLRAVEYIVRGLYCYHTGSILSKGEIPVHVKYVPPFQAPEVLADYVQYPHQGGKIGDVCLWSYDLSPRDPYRSMWVLFFLDGVVFLGATGTMAQDNERQNALAG